MEKASRSIPWQFVLGTHAIVIALLRRQATGSIIVSMFVLGLIGFFTTS